MQQRANAGQMRSAASRPKLTTLPLNWCGCSRKARNRSLNEVRGWIRPPNARSRITSLNQSVSTGRRASGLLKIRLAAFFGFSPAGGRDHRLEVFDGWTEVALPLTVQPEGYLSKTEFRSSVICVRQT